MYPTAPKSETFIFDLQKTFRETAVTTAPGNGTATSTLPRPPKTEIDAWARHATASNGFADAAAPSYVPRRVPARAVLKANSARRPVMSATEMNEARIAYSDNGTGEPVLLIHCSSASGTEWNSLCATLGGDFRSIAPDQWGCGQSDPWTGENAFTLAEEAAPILDIIQSIGVQVHLVGHSYGGGVALRIARERPYMIRSLTLIEPSAFHLLRYGGPADRALFGEIAKVAEAVRKAIAGSDSCAGMSRFVDYWNGEGAWMALPEQTRGKLARRLDKVVLDFQALFDEPADLEIYAALPHPTLVLCGDRSPAPSRRIVEMLASAMPSARAERIPGANHMSPITHPDEVNRAVRRHLLRHGAAHLPLAA